MENYLVMARSELVKKSWRKQCILQMKEARLKGCILCDSHYDILENNYRQSRNIRDCQGVSRVGGVGEGDEQLALRAFLGQKTTLYNTIAVDICIYQNHRTVQHKE